LIPTIDAVNIRDSAVFQVDVQVHLAMLTPKSTMKVQQLGQRGRLPAGRLLDAFHKLTRSRIFDLSRVNLALNFHTVTWRLHIFLVAVFLLAARSETMIYQ
jgi:hypothetical protein